MDVSEVRARVKFMFGVEADAQFYPASVAVGRKTPLYVVSNASRMVFCGSSVSFEDAIRKYSKKFPVVSA